MIGFTLNDKRYQVPTEWSELSPEELLDVCQIMHSTPKSKLLAAIFKRLCKVSSKYWKALSLNDRFELVRLVEPLTYKRMLYPKFDSFTHQDVEYHLPPHELRMESSIAVAMADLHMKAFLQNEQANSHSLDLMIASLCRPLRRHVIKNDQWDGYTRERYHSVLAEERAKLFSTLDFRVKLFVLHYFIGSLEYLQATYKPVYMKPIPKPGQKPAKQPPKGLGMIPWLMAIAESGAFGTFEQVCHTDIHTLHIFTMSRV